MVFFQINNFQNIPQENREEFSEAGLEKCIPSKYTKNIYIVL